ncbi:MAG: phage head-tail adapter protein [Lachnospiraceae bacterium]|nr:phage head-tail adapter protein [Lachnospiraceae bacterium]
MNKEWSEKNKRMQTLIGKEAGFAEGMDVLLDLRKDLFSQISSIVNTCPEDAFYRMPFAGAEGYHSKTLAYSMWHIFRIEDIVAHTLILGDEQILFSGGWKKKTKSPIITTGNELKGEEIAEFSKKLDIKALHEYCRTVMDSTDELLLELYYKDLKRSFFDEDKNRVIDSRCVSTDEDAIWLVDYWCKKDIRGLIKMPFSRHWIMHIEAMCRIKAKLDQKARKAVD